MKHKKSLVVFHFHKWLDMMEVAHQQLDKREFRELEEKIKQEIAFARRKKK